jgi:hypothetical protein
MIKGKHSGVSLKASLAISREEEHINFIIVCSKWSDLLEDTQSIEKGRIMM